jgi:IS5 family transposase
MKQQPLDIDLTCRRTRKRVFLAEMEQTVPWAALLALIAPHAPVARTGRPPFALESLLRIHFLQQWYGLSDVAMEEALFDVPLYREFAGLGGMRRIPDRVSLLRFRHLLEKHDLAQAILDTVNAHLAAKGYRLREGTVVDATLIAAPSSTKNRRGERDPEMHQAKKGNQWHFGMKAHIGVDAETGLVHSVVGTAANVSDVTQAHALLHGGETVVYADAGYQGVDKRPENQDTPVTWRVAMRPGRRRALPDTDTGRLQAWIERIKASIRAKVEHPFRIIKRQFGHTKVRYRGLAKNTAQLITLFALGNLWLCRKRSAPASAG